MSSLFTWQQAGRVDLKYVTLAPGVRQLLTFNVVSSLPLAQLTAVNIPGVSIIQSNQPEADGHTSCQP